MSVVKNVIYDGGLQRVMSLGDVLGAGEILPATIVANALTITGAMLQQPFIQRTITGAGTDTLDTAINIIAALSQGMNLVGIQPGTTWRIKWINNAAFVDTVTATANTGVTVVNGTVNASSVKEFLVTIVNGTPGLVTGAAVFTNGSAVVTGLLERETRNLSPGMVVTNAIAGVQGATILSVQANVGVTLSTNATSTVVGSMTLSPVVTLTGLGQGLL